MTIKGFGVFRTFRILATALTICTLLHSQNACAEDPHFLFGAPFSGGSGGATNDVNRQGFGTKFRAGHDAGKTVGRVDSITYVELMPFVNIDNGLVFGDSRLVYSNRQRLAWSFGGGYRHYIPECGVVIGGYGYFDSDELTGSHMKQWSVGGDIFGDGWEGRANYYRPFGTTSELVGDRADPNSASFSGNQLLFDRIQTFAQGYEGGDAEIGFRLPGRISRQLDLKAFGGAYYYDGGMVGDTTGWKARLQAEIRRHVELGLTLTDDELFHTNVMFNLAFRTGGFSSQEHTKSSPAQHLGDHVRRNMNIVGSNRDTTLPGQVAIDARTGLPFRIVHVDSNTAGLMDGTFENPFDTIVDGRADTGPDDVLYVHAGSTFNDAANNNIALEAGERIFGEGLVPTSQGPRTIVNTVLLDDLGTLVLPQSTAFLASGETLGRPELIGAAGDGLVLNNDTILTGLIFDSTAGNGIYGNAVDNVDIRDVLVRDAMGDGILLENTTGVTAFRDTTVEGSIGSAFHVNGGTGTVAFGSTSTMADPAFGSIMNTSGSAVHIENMAGGSVNLTSATIDDDGGDGITINDNNSTVTIDNATLANSTGTGVSITNSGGRITFRNSLRAATVIDGAAGDAFFVDSLLANGNLFVESLQIDNRNAAGIHLENVSGNIRVSDDVTINAPAGGADPGILVNNSQTGSAINFLTPVTITGSGGTGLTVTNTQTDSNLVFEDTLSIGVTTLEGILVDTDAGNVEFNGVNIGQRADEGIRINNLTGTAAFNLATTVQNPSSANFAAVEITNSTGNVGFESLNITNAADNPGGGSGLHMTNNIAVPGVGTANISIDDLQLSSDSGTAMFGRDNTNVTIRGGTIIAQGGPAIDLENTGVAMLFQSVSSFTSPTFGIRLVETESFGDFSILGDPQLTGFGAGGTIQDSTGNAIELMNSGRVLLRQMQLINGLNGIFVRDTGITDDTDRFLELNEMRITQSDLRGIDAENALQLTILDTQFDQNGDGTNTTAGRETIYSIYNERPNDPDTLVFSEYDNPYIFTMRRSMILDDSHDSIVIANTTGNEVNLPTSTGNDAHMLLTLQNNSITNSDGVDLLTTDLIDDNLIIVWNGPLNSLISGNAFSMTGTGQDAIDIQTTSITDRFDNVILQNSINSTSPGAFGFRIRSIGPSVGQIENNNMLFANGDSTGMNFDLAGTSTYVINNNTYTDNTDGGAGIVFNSVIAPASFTMNGNVITLFDQGVGGGGGIEEGIIFRAVAGVVDLNGTPNNTNIVQLGNFGFGSFIETIFFMPAGTNNGQIFVNGIGVP